MKTIHLVRSGLLAAVFLCFLPALCYAQSNAVARVGSIPITKFELGRETQKLVPLNSSFHKGISREKIAELKQEALGKLIERAYMIQYALSEELSVDSEDIDAIFKPVREKFSSREDFQKALGEESIAEFRASIYRKLLAEKALEVAVEQKVSIDQEEIRDYYEENRDRFKRPRQFRASHILIKVDPSGTAEEKAQRLEFAQELVSKARAGEDFYNLAYYNSDDRTKFVGGDMGYFHKGQMIPEIEEVLLEMEVDEISDPIETIYGFSIIKLVEDNPPKQMSYQEIRPRLIESERKEQFEAIRKAWLDSLRDKYDVQYTSS